MVLAAGKFFEFFSYVTSGLVIFLFILLFWIILRQRSIRKQMSDLVNRVRKTLLDGAEQNKTTGEKQIIAIRQALKDLNPLFEKLDKLEMKVEAIERQIEFNQSGIQEALTDLNSNSTEDKLEEELESIRDVMEKISVDLAGAHQWLDELRILEKVVLNLIGPDKLRTLIEKEKGLLVTPAKNNVSQKKSIL